MYKLISIFGILIRQFCLPNPFECFGNIAIIYNWIAGIILVPLSYYLVGTVYDQGSAPAIGSLLFLLVYASLTGMLCLLGLFSFAWWAILIMIAVIVLVFVLGRRFGVKRPIE